MKRLIVNADDFGLTAGINSAILELNEASVVTSATLMASGASFASAVHAAFVQTSLGVGCHAVLVDGQPVLPAKQIPSLMGSGPGESPRFRNTLGELARDLIRGRIREEEIELEIAAQIRRLQSSGLHVTHLDTHKHTHIFRGVLRPLIRAALQCGVEAIRNPFEPGWSVRATPGGGLLRRAQVRALRVRRPSFLRTVRRHGIATTDGAIGVQATGTLDELTLKRLLSAMPKGDWELVCHPGYLDGDLERVRTRLLGSRETERHALLEVLPEFLAKDPSLQLIHFGQLRLDSMSGNLASHKPGSRL